MSQSSSLVFCALENLSHAILLRGHDSVAPVLALRSLARTKNILFIAMRLILPEHERIPIPGLVPSLAFFGPILILWLPSNAYRSLLCAFLCLALVPLPGLIDTFGDTDKNCGQGAWVAFVILQ